MMEVYNFNLVDNRDFYAWSVEPRAGMSFMDLDQDPELKFAWNDAMHSFFGYPITRGGNDVEQVPLDSVVIMRKALAALYWYRVDLGLEIPVMYRRELSIYYPPPELYFMCSEWTQLLASIYVDDFMMQYCCNADYINYPEMIVDLTEWADKIYSN